MNRNVAANPWLSVVIPSYCGEQWIDAALKSLVAQTESDFEVILVDGSPTSATRDIAATYSDRLRLEIIERNDLTSWQTKTNFAVQNAQASHVCWLGVDDLWLARRSAAVRGWIAAAPSAPLHLAPAAVIGKDGQKLGIWRCPLPSNRELSPQLVSRKLLMQNFVAAPAPVFRRDSWLAFGGLDESLWYTADWDIWLKLASLAPLYYHKDITVGFRIHAGSLTMTGRYDPRVFAQQQQTVVERHLATLGNGSRQLERAARASIAVNTALASASAGDFRALLGAVFSVLKLGPAGICQYVYTSRIWERLAPRIRAKLTRAL